MLKIGVDIDNTITNTSKLANDLLKKDFIFKKFLDYHNLNENDYMLFLNKYLDNIECNVGLNKDVCEVLEYLHNKGCYIVIITARGSMNFKNTEINTINYLEKNKVNYDKIIFKQESKLQACLDEQIDIFIDDKITVLDEMINKNIITIKFGDCVKKISHKIAKNWLEVKNIIDTIINNE